METQRALEPLLDQVDLGAIDEYLETLYESNATQNAGEQMAKIELDSSQIRKLENLVMSTRRFSEIINYIKNQAGKEKKEKKWSNIASTLLTQLDEIENKAKEIGNNNFAKIIDVKKHLARGWVKQIVAHYLYTKLLIGGSET